VSTLVWGVGWSIFFGSHKDCFCDVKNPAMCYCSVAFDLQQEESAAIFYALTGIATFCFMFATLFSVLQMIMIAECSDESELKKFSGVGQMPGTLFCIGIACLVIPVHIYIIVTRQFGAYWTVQDDDLQIMVFSLILLISIFLMFSHTFYYKLPSFVAHVYNAKVTQAKRDRVTAAEKQLESHLGIKTAP